MRGDFGSAETKSFVVTDASTCGTCCTRGAQLNGGDKITRSTRLQKVTWGGTLTNHTAYDSSFFLKKL